LTGFGVFVRFILRPGHADAFDALVAQTLEGIRGTEPGTLVYLSHSVEGDPTQRVFYELYQDRASFDLHEAQDHVKHFLATRGDHVESYTVDFLNLVDGKLP
jgi:quinol monooxygenase YgiN